MNLAQALMGVIGGGFRFVTSAQALNTGNITIPSGCATGDLLVLVDRAVNASGTYPTAVTPSGFTSINNTFGDNGVIDRWQRQILYYQHAASDLSGTTVTGMTGTAVSQKLLLVFRGTSAFASATPAGAGGGTTNSNPTAQTLAINGLTAPILAIAAFSAGSSNSMNGASSVVHTNGVMEVLYRIYTTDPAADLTADTGDGGTLNTLQSCYIQLTY